MPTTSELFEDVQRSALGTLASWGLTPREEKPAGPVGGLGEVQLGNEEGRRVLVKVLEVDANTNTARVKRTDNEEEMSVDVIRPGASQSKSTFGKNVLLDNRSNSCVQDYEDSFELLMKDAASPSRPLAASPIKEEVQASIPEEKATVSQPSATGQPQHQHYNISAVLGDGESDTSEEPEEVDVPEYSQDASTESSSAWKAVDGFVTRMASIDLMADLQSAADATLKETTGTWEKLSSESSWDRLGIAPGRGTKGVSTWEQLGLPSSMKELETSTGWEKFDPVDMITRMTNGTPSTFERAAQPPSADSSGERVVWANVTPPVDLSFNLPESLQEGQQQICISGPHGPLQVPVPEGKKPGDRVEVRVGPSNAFRVTVPEGMGEGDTVAIELPNGERIQTQVPPGKQPGDHFDVSQAVLMVQVPVGVEVGDKIRFLTREGREVTISVPEGAATGQYFEFSLEAPKPSTQQPKEQGPSKSSIEKADKAVFE